MRDVYQDMPLIAQQLGVPETSVSYHESLLSSYFVNDPQDSNPPLLMAFYLFILLLVSVSLILIIHNSFAVSMNARVHQFGIFSSIGATPGQIRTCLLQEAAMLCVIPVLIGSFVGIALTFGAIQAVNVLADGIVGRHEAVFIYHPFVFAVTILSLLRSHAPRMINLFTVRRSACKPLLPGISPGVSTSLVRSISVLASLPRRPYPLQPVIRFSRFCACLQEPVYRKKRPFPVYPRRWVNA